MTTYLYREMGISAVYGALMIVAVVPFQSKIWQHFNILIELFDALCFSEKFNYLPNKIAFSI